MTNYIDMWSKITAIKSKYGADYFFNERTLKDLIDLWGGHPNDHGVFPSKKEELFITKKLNVAINFATTSKGYWLYSLTVSNYHSGFSSAPSVWKKYAFLSRDDARCHAIGALLEWANKQTEDKDELEKLKAILISEQTPQLALF